MIVVPEVMTVAATLPRVLSNRVKTRNHSKDSQRTQVVSNHELRQGSEVDVAARLARVFTEVGQRLYHGFARNSDNAGEWKVKFEDYGNSAGNREGASNQGESACSVSNPRSIRLDSVKGLDHDLVNQREETI
jgi:hypothetical protein